jgi:hypothetical protein
VSLLADLYPGLLRSSDPALDLGRQVRRCVRSFQSFVSTSAVAALSCQ